MYYTSALAWFCTMCGIACTLLGCGNFLRKEIFRNLEGCITYTCTGLIKKKMKHRIDIKKRNRSIAFHSVLNFVLYHNSIISVTYSKSSS